MKIETEMDAGSAGYFLVDDSVQLLNIFDVRVTQTCRYIGGAPSEPLIEYQVDCGKNKGEDSTWVPAKRAAKTKAELLAKL
jgi:hypothetical protein